MKKINRILENPTINTLLLYSVVFACWLSIFFITKDPLIIILLTVWLGILLIIAEWYKRCIKTKENELTIEDVLVKEKVQSRLGKDIKLERYGEDRWLLQTPFLDAHNDYIEVIIEKQNRSFRARLCVTELIYDLMRGEGGFNIETLKRVAKSYGAVLFPLKHHWYLSISQRTNEDFPRLYNLLTALLTYNAWLDLKRGSIQSSNQGGKNEDGDI